MTARTLDAIARKHVALLSHTPGALPADVGLESGRGDRRTDCRNIGECLKRFCAARRGNRAEVEGRCPAGCTHYVAPSRDAQIQLAVTRGEA